jgi:pimeloyl-ACP methyl ester carboxylesterase
MTVNYVKIGDLNICYLDNNLLSDKVILFSHGWGADKNNLSGIFNNFINDFRVIAIDLPGFGESSSPAEVIGSPEYSDIIRKFLDNLGIKKITYVGHSFGGKIGIILASKYPELIEKLILINSGGLRAKRNLIWYLKVYSFKFLKYFYSKILKDQKKIDDLKNKHGSDDYKNAGNMRNILVKTVSEDFSELLPQIKAPTFLYWGNKDSATPLWMAKKMNKLIKDSGLYVVKNGGHFSFVDDNRIISIIRSLMEK